MLTLYCQNVLKLLLQKTDYDGLTADQGWAWLMDPVSSPTVQQAAFQLRPISVAKVLGAAKAEKIGAAIKTTFPSISDDFSSEGVDPLSPLAQELLATLLSSGAISQADAQTLTAAAVQTVQPPPLPARFHERFTPHNWPANIDGATGNAVDAAVVTYCQFCGFDNPELPTTILKDQTCVNCGRVIGPDVHGNTKLGAAMGLHGFPNSIERADFDAAWVAAGRVA